MNTLQLNGIEYSPLFQRRRLSGTRPGVPKFTGCEVPWCRHFKRRHTTLDLRGPGFICDCKPDVNFGDRLGEPTDTGISPERKEKEIEGCCAAPRLRRKVLKIVKFLSLELDLNHGPVPTTVTCGGIRKAVRSCYPPELTLVQELSIKTSMKVEANPCTFCKTLQAGSIEKWEKSRLAPATVSEEHLSAFSAAFARNIPRKWDEFRSPYIPNGHSTNDFKRSQGGNWNIQDTYSPEFQITQVTSSGKPRIVTIYGENYVRTLTPLHMSLYCKLKRKGWLLVGSPTNERLRRVSQGCAGNDWISVDYQSATDNIKTAYVRRAVEELIKAGDLSNNEITALIDMANDKTGWETGQPMGSPMSFPLLCMINKTVVDMALTDLLKGKEISFKEWTSHRCLINGDDLLTKSTSNGDLFRAICTHGSQVGLVTNLEKTLIDPKWGEINSTPFYRCKKQKKTNVHALWMEEQVADVIGFARASTVTIPGFLQCVKNNANRLARQKVKSELCLGSRRVRALFKNRSTREAVSSIPISKVPEVTNLFPVEVMPDNFVLSRQEQDEAINEHVQLIRDRNAWVTPLREKKKIKKQRRKVKTEVREIAFSKFNKLLKPKKPSREKQTLSIFVRRWEKSRKEGLADETYGLEPAQIVSDLSGIDRIIDAIKAWRQPRLANDAKALRPLRDDPVSNGRDFVGFDPG